MQLPRQIRDLKYFNIAQFHWKEFRFVNITLFKWLIILAVLFFSSQAGRIADFSLLKQLIMLVGGFAFILITLRNMPLALTLVLLTSATSGITIETGRTTPLPAGLLMIVALTAIWLYKMMLVEHRITLKPSPLNLPVLLFLISTLISWLIGYVVWDWRVIVEKNILLVQIGQYALFLFSFAVMFLVAHQNLSEKDLRLWMTIVIVIGLGEILMELLLGIRRGRENGILGSLFVFPLVLLVAQLLFNPRFNTWGRIISIASVLIWLLWDRSMLNSKGTWMPALFGLAMLVFYRSWKLGLLGVAAAAAVIFLKWDVLVATLYLPEVASNSTVRVLIWQDIANMVLPRSPLFGLGLANYFYYWNIPSLVPLSRIAAGWDKWNAYGYAIPSHNMFVDVFAQTGLIGLILFLWGIGAALWVAYRVIHQLKPGFLRAYAIGVAVGFVAMLASSFLFADWLIPFVYNITITGFRHSVYSWILFGTVLGLYYNLKNESPDHRT